MALRLMSFIFVINHNQGIENIADFLSGHPLELSTEISEKEEIESYVALKAEYSTPSAISRETLIHETQNDERLNLLKKIILTETIDNRELAKSD
jgi:hypothetical protein